MKKTYEVFVNRTGNPSGSGTRMNIQAESEHEAIQIAKKRHPNEVVASIKQK
ncbi:MAG: hypothetical protein IJY33_01460 [Oscillospiraceae bacterium]|nr:hypothetical protein [Oscillospiraceae bacterium]